MKETQVVEAVQKVLRAEVQQETPAQLESKSAAAAGREQDWRTINQLNALAAVEESSPRPFDKGYWLLALPVLIALGALLCWLLRRQRAVSQKSGARLDLSDPPIATSL